MERACADDGLSSKISGLSGLLSISSILSLVLLGFPRPSKGSVWGSTQTHVDTRALLGPRASASHRRALRGAARGGADAVSRFPLLAPEARCGALRTPIPLPGQKWPAWPTRSLNVLLRKPLEVSEATIVEFIGLKRVATRLLPKFHGPRFRHRRRNRTSSADERAESKLPAGLRKLVKFEKVQLETM